VAKGEIRPYLERTMSRLTASRAAFDLIASFEGFRTRAALAPDGRWTLGFGHTATAREGLTVTRNEAEDLLRWDLLPIEDMVRQSALTPLSQNQFDALVSFAYNIGLESFRTSDVLKYLNQGQPVAAALSMHAWRRAPVNGRVLTIDALVRRRAAESALFLETVGARPAAPSSVVRPQIDGSALLTAHAVEAVEPLAERRDTKQIERHVDVSDRDETNQAMIDEVVVLDGVAEATPPGVGEGPSLTPPQVTTIAAQTQQDVLVEALPNLSETESPEPEPEPEQELGPEPEPEELKSEVPELLLQAPLDEPVEAKLEAKVDKALDQGPVVLPSMPIPPPADLPQTKAKDDFGADGLAQRGPMVPDGLSPFPGSADYTPANGTRNTITPPANDSLKTRLHGAPEILEMPTATPTEVAQPKAASGNGYPLLVWGLMILGAALLGFGLFYSWKSGILTVASPRRDPTTNELSALFAAASGLIILVTSAVSALTRDRDDA
jgi:lysozyme